MIFSLSINKNGTESKAFFGGYDQSLMTQLEHSTKMETLPIGRNQKMVFFG